MPVAFGDQADSFRNDPVMAYRHGFDPPGHQRVIPNRFCYRVPSNPPFLGIGYCRSSRRSPFGSTTHFALACEMAIKGGLNANPR